MFEFRDAVVQAGDFLLQRFYQLTVAGDHPAYVGLAGLELLRLDCRSAAPYRERREQTSRPQKPAAWPHRASQRTRIGWVLDAEHGSAPAIAPASRKCVSPTRQGAKPSST